MNQHLRRRIDLAGSWEIIFNPSEDLFEDLIVPGSWPSSGSDKTDVPGLWNVTHPEQEGVGVYHHRFEVPADWAGSPASLCFDGVSYHAGVWLNGEYIGNHEGAYTPFRLPATTTLRYGAENELIVRVTALSRERDIEGFILTQSPASKQVWYYRHGGLWGDIYIEVRANVSCEDLFLLPDPQRECVLVEAKLRNNSARILSAKLRMNVTAPHGAPVSEITSDVVLPPGTHTYSYRIEVRHPTLWSCETPDLYLFDLRISAGDEIFEHTSNLFGMRSFTVHQGRFFLNDKAIYLKGLLLQPNYPRDLIKPPWASMMKDEIQLARDAGFNMIRCHIRPAPPGYLDLADRMGMLIYAESSLAWIRESPRLLDHARREIGEMVLRDRNHPSVVIWGLHNENRPAHALTSEPLIRMVRALDPSRVIIDNSGGTMAIDQDFGWVDRATVVPDGDVSRQDIQDVHIYVGAPLTSAVYEWMRSLGNRDAELDLSVHDFGTEPMLAEWQRELRTYTGDTFVSEVGVGGMANLDQVLDRFNGREDLLDAHEYKIFRDELHEGFKARGLETIFGTVEELVHQSQLEQAQGIRRQIEALLSNPRVSGYIITQLNDVAWEFHAGIMNPWREPKPAYHALKMLQKPQSLILKADAAAVEIGAPIHVRATMVNQAPLPESAHVLLRVLDPQGMVLEEFTLDAPATEGIWPLDQPLRTIPDQPGEIRIEASLLQGERILFQTFETVLVLPATEEGDAPAVQRYPDPSAGELDEHAIIEVPKPAKLGERQWVSLLETVGNGGVAVLGPLSNKDHTAIALLAEFGTAFDPQLGIGNWMGCFHWVPDSPLFEGLPAGSLAGEPYAEILPWYVTTEMGGEVLAGSIRNTQTRQEPPRILWYSDVEAVPFREGTVLFCQYRIFDSTADNPLASRMRQNLLRLAVSYLK